MPQLRTTTVQAVPLTANPTFRATVKWKPNARIIVVAKCPWIFVRQGVCLRAVQLEVSPDCVVLVSPVATQGGGNVDAHRAKAPVENRLVAIGAGRANTLDDVAWTQATRCYGLTEVAEINRHPAHCLASAADVRFMFYAVWACRRYSVLAKAYVVFHAACVR